MTAPTAAATTETTCSSNATINPCAVLDLSSIQTCSKCVCYNYCQNVHIKPVKKICKGKAIYIPVWVKYRDGAKYPSACGAR